MAAVDLRWRKLGGHTGTSASKSVFLDLAVKRYRELNPTLVPLVDPFCYAPWSATEEGIVDEILAPRKKNMEVGPYVQRVVWKLVRRLSSAQLCNDASLKRKVFFPSLQEHKRNMTDAWRFVEKRIKVLFDETTESRAEAKKGKA